VKHRSRFGEITGHDAAKYAVEMKVARFCWFNKAKFGGNIYCMNCQKSIP